MTAIRLDRSASVAVITIDRRDRFNSLDVETAQEFRRAGLQCARDPEVRAVILRGEGGVFCSGADLKYIRAGGDSKDLGYLQDGRPQRGGYGAVFQQILEYIHSAISEIKRAPKAFVAAVDGVAAAGGFGIAMACDLVFASERASFEWAYGKTGLTGAESSTFFLPRLLGLRRAMELVLMNPRLDAKTALEWQLVNAVFPTDGFDDRVLEIARRIAAGPAEALGIAKNLVNQAAGVDRLDFHLDREIEALARIADGADFREGLDAFFEKRAPEFGLK
ncbi:MAG TPA: enoyl-CoA hydratase-related protein [Thermoanaerobaculia bacterium]|jgi:2-(1,2-epoxy-1,2-dihydrophenyl)acetyl-CoA isomerase|nr:enoyl-CoA hydratase-related protein [Thermoanaerobaculia bacterium]